jgi:DNA-binding response OmpR family regulator
LPKVLRQAGAVASLLDDADRDERGDSLRLLIVEDNDRLSEYVSVALRREGFAVDAVPSGADADAAILTTAYNAVVLDLGLPDVDGLNWLSAVRGKANHIPVLVLTARDGVNDVVAGLNAGADDYLKKPFEITELVARLRALLRRPGQALGTVLSQGNLTFDVNSREVSIDGAAVDLGRREAAVLELLLRRCGRVVSKAAIEEATYGYGEELSSNAIEVLIHRLRKRMCDGGADVSIHTLRGVGYVLSNTPG